MKTFVQQHKLSSGQSGGTGANGGGAQEAGGAGAGGAGKRLPDTMSPQAQAALDKSFASKVCMRMCLVVCVCASGGMRGARCLAEEVPCILPALGNIGPRP